VSQPHDARMVDGEQRTGMTIALATEYLERVASPLRE
jgi:hypothetical protein